MQERLIKLYGLQRSGTNWGADLAERYLPVTVRHSLVRWKHDTPKACAPYSGYLVLWKNPVAWVASMRRYSRASTRDLRDLCLIWNSYGLEILRFASVEERAATLHYDRALRDQTEAVRFMARRWKLPLPDGEVSPTLRAYARAGDKTPEAERVTDTPFDPARYLDYEYLRELDRAELNRAYGLIDWDIYQGLKLASGP